MTRPDFISLYGKTYARTATLAAETLFDPKGTCNGIYTADAKGIYFRDLSGKERAFIRADGLGPVSLHRDQAGRLTYMYSTSSDDDRWLGTPDSYGAQCDEARAIARQVLQPAA